MLLWFPWGCGEFKVSYLLQGVGVPPGWKNEETEGFLPFCYRTVGGGHAIETSMGSVSVVPQGRHQTWSRSPT